MKYKFGLLPLIAITAVFSFSAMKKSEDTEKICIEQLADSLQAKRDAAATKLRDMVVKGKTTYADGHIAEHDSSYWYAMVARSNMRLLLNDVVKSLALDTGDQEIGMCFGQGCFNSYRLDNSMVLQLYYKSNAPHTVYFDTLIWDPRRINVDAPVKFTGEWTTYYANGQPSHRVQYSNGDYNGTFISYHPNGQIAYQQHYSNGVANGEDRGFYFSGKLAYVGTYKDGKQSGEWIHYWENGKVKTKMNFEAGEHHGIETEYFENGMMYAETTYDHGKQTRHRAWNKKGDCIFDTDKMK